MDNIFYGATKEQAIINAEKAFNLDRQYLIIEFLDESESKSIFSILNKKNVKIIASVNKSKKQLIDKLKNNIKKRKNRLTAEELEKNKKIILNFLNEFLKFNLSIDISFTLEEKEKNFYINLNSDNNAILIGNKGSTINAIQTYIQSLLIHKIKPSANVFVDSGNYKIKRKEYLVKLAEDTAFKIRQTGEEVALEPMNSYERKIVHAVISNYPDLETNSIGKEPNRYIKIFLAKI